MMKGGARIKKRELEGNKDHPGKRGRLLEEIIRKKKKKKNIVPIRQERSAGGWRALLCLVGYQGRKNWEGGDAPGVFVFRKMDGKKKQSTEWGPKKIMNSEGKRDRF